MWGTEKTWRQENENDNTARSIAQKRAEQRLPAGLAPCLQAFCWWCWPLWREIRAWKALHDVLFGLFGCGSFVLGAAVCCLAVQYTRGEDLLPAIFKLILGLVFACGTVIVFFDIQPQGMSAFQMTAACYANGVSCMADRRRCAGRTAGRQSAAALRQTRGKPLIMAVLALCVSLYIF